MWDGDSLPAEARAPHRVRVLLWEEFMALGDEDGLAEEVEHRIAEQRPGHCCTLIYTSGTTGPPKAVMISHDNITWTAKAVQSIAPWIGAGAEGEHIVSYLPLSHVAGQMVDIHFPIVLAAARAGVRTVHFARPDALKGTLGETLRAARPTVFLGVPRVWEKIHEQMKPVSYTHLTLPTKA